jgi:hypothetical protein
VTGIFVSYFKYNTAVQFKTFVDSPAEFPAVTICNLNPINGDDNGTIEYIENMEAVYNVSSTVTLSGNDSLAIEEVLDVKTKFRYYVTADKNLTDAEREKLGFTLETMLISCFFNDVQCSTADFQWFYSHEYGNCYMFNSNINGNNTLKSTSKTGMSNGLRLELFVGIPGDTYNQDILTVSRGAYVAIHNNTRYPEVRYEGITVATGKATNIGIKRTYHYNLDSPYSDCRKNVSVILDNDSDYYRNTLSINEYSQILCYDICYDDLFVQKNCSCSDPSIPYHPDNVEICWTTSQIECTVTQRKQLEKSSLSEYCDSYCPRECDFIYYSTSVSMSDYPTTYYGYIFDKHPDVEEAFTPKRDTNTITDVVGRIGPLTTVPIPTISMTTPSTITATVPTVPVTTPATITVTVPTVTVTTPATITVTVPTVTVTTPATITVTVPIVTVTTPTISTPLPTTSNNRDNIKKAICLVNIYYLELRYTNIEEIPAITPETLLGVLGTYMFFYPLNFKY